MLRKRSLECILFPLPGESHCPRLLDQWVKLCASVPRIFVLPFLCMFMSSLMWRSRLSIQNRSTSFNIGSKPVNRFQYQSGGSNASLFFSHHLIMSTNAAGIHLCLHEVRTTITKHTSLDRINSIAFGTALENQY